MITKKRLTKLINGDFRRSILISMSEKKKIAYKIKQYAQYVTDLCIVHRSVEHEKDKNWNYGFTPIQCLGACMKNGTISKRFFEFNSVNHFLKDKDGDSAREVVEAILIEWAKEDHDIVDFDMDRIDAEFAKIEAEYIEEQKTLDAVKTDIMSMISEYGNSFSAWPVKIEDLDGIGKACTNLLQPVKEKYNVFKIVVSMVKNAQENLDAGEFYVTIGLKLNERDEFRLFDAVIRKQDEKLSARKTDVGHS